MFLTRWLDNFRSLQRPEQRTAWAIAVAADALQIAVFPLFAEGGASPADTALDLVVAFLLTKLLGWHWAFLPSLGAELLPGIDLFPTWTAAVWFVTRGENPSTEPEIMPPGPAPAPRPK
ncbi:MAG: hypothetical protein ACXVZV_07960 [Terriglobales bacterium]